ncbi:NADP-dependent alcohol dehydrogenase [Aspergillus terreus]|uniref:NADP-dependent alcohol dehydrogenase n=1 Tax=Aspergillus terreus TaxID=33178 RepID=A0A5M3YVT7_ASPTE|nr:hypothetical protein ATETN484_0005004600 [Aspergillus terreus]GFF16713.1 NADP-dependent alcohol dehydrogenase [Aspergillus terreus]
MVKAIQFRGSPSQEIVETTFDLPELQAAEVLIRVTHSGLCGSELYMLDRPLVLGHEGIGIVEAVGPACTRLGVGDRVGWGPVNATCGDCEPCLKGQESYCNQIKLYGFDAYDRSGSLCSHAVRSEQWLFRIPDGLPSADAAPLMCGGGTVWAALIEHCRPFHRVGIVGVGGLGHLAVQFAAKMGCHVSVFSSTADKEEMARRLGAHQFYATRGVTDYTALGVDGPIDRLLITSSAKPDLAVLYPLLDRNAVIIPLNKMLDFAARHHITCAVEHYPMTLQSVKDAMERLRKGTIRYRAVFSWDRPRNGYCEDSHDRSGTRAF